MVMVNSKPFTNTLGSLTNGTRSSLEVQYLLVLLCGNSVGLTNMGGVALLSLRFLKRSVVAITSWPWVLSYSVSSDTFRYTVFASLSSQVSSPPLSTLDFTIR